MTAAVLLLGLAAGQPPAALSCPVPVAARGEVKAGPPLVHTFELVNSAAAPLTITRVEAACGCLRRGLTAETIRPGETAKLSVEVNTLTQPDGPNRWQVAVGYRLDTPAGALSGDLVLAVTATLSRDVIVSPPQVAFSTAGTVSQTITITDRRPMPVTIARAAASSPHLSATVTPPAVVDGVRRQTVTITLAADAPIGQRDETVVLQTDDPAYPEFRVPVRVVKRAADGLVVTPDAVAVRLTPGQAEVSALVQLRSADGRPLRIVAATSDRPEVTARWPDAEAAVTAVRVTVAADRPGVARLTVRLAGDPAREVVVPVTWTGAGR